MSDVELSDVGDDDIIREHENHDENNEMDQGSDQDIRNVSGDEVINADDGDKEDPSTKTKKKIVRKMIVLNTERLKGSKGVHTIEKLYEGFKFKGKGHEKEDLDRVMKKLEYWAYRLFPKLEFDDFLAKCEHLGHKKDLHTHLKKYRTGIINADSYAIDEIDENDKSDDEVQVQTERNISNENDLERLVDETERQRNTAFQRLFDENQQIQQINENVQILNNERLVGVTGETDKNVELPQLQSAPGQAQFVDDDEFEKLISETGQVHENIVQTQQINQSVNSNNEKTNQVIDDDDFDILMAETG